MWNAVSAALVLGACSPSPRLADPDRVETRTWWRISVAGRSVGLEERVHGRDATGQRVVVRRRTYAFDGLSSHDGASEATLDPDGAVSAYRLLDGDRVRTWRATGSRPVSLELAAADRALQTGTVRALDPATLTVRAVDVTTGEVEGRWFAGWTEGALQVRVEVGSEGVVATSGLLRMETIPAADAVLPASVDLLDLLRRPAPALAAPERTTWARFRVGDGEREVRVPLRAEIPADLALADDSADLAAYRQAGLPLDVVPVVDGVRGRLEAVGRLGQWVRGRLQVAPTPGTPEALRALQTGRGDCNEHAAVWVAAARSVGIPARPVAGLVYAATPEPGLVPHAWAEVHLGPAGWVATDPTLGQDVADATHLRLGEGAVDAALLAVLGAEQIALLEAR